MRKRKYRNKDRPSQCQGMILSYNFYYIILYETDTTRHHYVQCKLNEAKTLFVVFTGETKRVGRDAAHDGIAHRRLFQLVYKLLLFENACTLNEHRL